MDSNVGGRPPKWSEFKQILLNNERARGTPGFKTCKELALDFGISLPYAYSMRSKLIKKGLLPKISEHTPPSLRLPNTSLEDLKRALESEIVMSREDWLKILSHIARTGAPVTKIQAIKALEDLTRSSQHRIGPPPPLSPDDKISRLARLIAACGKEIHDAAYKKAFEDPQTPPELLLAPEAPREGPGGVAI